MDPILWIRSLPAHMAEAARAMNPSRRSDRVRVIVQWLFLALSAVATGEGFYDIIRGGTQNPNPIMVVAAVVLAVLVVLFLWYSLEHALDRRVSGYMRATAWFLYFFFMFWSVAFGYGFYWKMFAATDRATQTFKGDVAEITQRLNAATTPVQSVVRTSRNVQQASQEKIDQEIRSGGSCDNDPSPAVGRGPYCNTRVYIAGQVTNLVNGLEASLSDNPATYQGLPKPDYALCDSGRLSPQTTQESSGQAIAPAAGRVAASSQAQVSDLEIRIQALIEDLRKQAETPTATNQEELAKKLEAKLNEAQNVIVTANGRIAGIKTSSSKAFRELAQALDSGVKYDAVCRDAGLAKELRGAANALDGLPEVDLIPPDQLKPSLGAKATYEAFMRVWGIFLRPLGLAGQQTEGKLTNEDLIALIAAVAVDVGILGATVLRRRRALDGLTDVLRTRIRSPRLRRALAELIRFDGVNLRLLFERSSVTFDGRHYLIATEQVHPYAASVGNIQAALAAAREGEYLRLDLAPLDWLRHGLLAPHRRQALTRAIQHRIALTRAQLNVDGYQQRGQRPGARIVLLSLTPAVWTALQLTADEIARLVAEDRANRRPEAAPSPPPQRPGPGQAGPGQAGPGTGPGVDVDGDAEPEPPTRPARRARQARASRQEAPEPAGPAPVDPFGAAPVEPPPSQPAAPPDRPAPRWTGGLDENPDVIPRRGGSRTLGDDGRQGRSPTLGDEPPPAAPPRGSTLPDPEDDGRV